MRVDLEMIRHWRGRYRGDVNSGVVILFVLAGVSAIIDWWSVATGRRSVEVVAKPATLLLLIATALVIDPATPSVRVWFVMGLVLSLAGDVFLLLDARLFVAGLASFLAAHIAYIVGLLVSGTDTTAVVIGVILVVLAIGVTGRRIHGAAAKTDPRLAIPVAAYIVVISAMLVAAIGTVNIVAVAGAALFYLSDTILGWNRFVSPIPNGRLLTMMSYHAAQALLVLALLSL
ncbi:MAG: lysoplasmalogenase [Armatimonadetes bacterium]|nr:MAG: lysoplasmalogenase [Armatimonadota bacterium]